MSFKNVLNLLQVSDNYDHICIYIYIYIYQHIPIPKRWSTISSFTIMLAPPFASMQGFVCRACATAFISYTAVCALCGALPTSIQNEDTRRRPAALNDITEGVTNLHTSAGSHNTVPHNNKTRDILSCSCFPSPSQSTRITITQEAYPHCAKFRSSQRTRTTALKLRSMCSWRTRTTTHDLYPICSLFRTSRRWARTTIALTSLLIGYPPSNPRIRTATAQRSRLSRSICSYFPSPCMGTDTTQVA